MAKTNTLASRRRAFSILGDHSLVRLLFQEIGPRFKERPGGFTRIIPLGARRGDGATMVILELTEIKKKEPSKKAKKEAKPSADDTHQKPEAAKGEGAKPKETRQAAHEERAEPKKPSKKFLGGIRKIFKKERDSL